MKEAEVIPPQKSPVEYKEMAVLPPRGFGETPEPVSDNPSVPQESPKENVKPIAEQTPAEQTKTQTKTVTKARPSRARK